MRPLPFLSVLLLALASPVHAADPAVTVRPDHANGIYSLGEKAVWTIDVQGDRSGLGAVPYVVRRDGQDSVAQGTVDLSAGPATVAASLDAPGCLLATLSTPEKKTLALGGAVFAPEKIGPAVPAPDDFDAFWDGQLKRLAAIPVNPAVERIPLEGADAADGIDYYHVSLDNVDGTRVRGQLARPSAGEKFPAMLVLQWAGVYPLEKAWATVPAKEGWLVLNIEAHDLPIDAPASFYEEQRNGPLKDYYYIGYQDRESSYFLRMLLGCVRAAEYLASRPDWDGRVLLATGNSQGGFQSLATAALFPRITHVITTVPAGCDISGQAGTPPRALGWPYWISNWKPREADMAPVKKTAGYFDAIHFAARVRCPTLIGPGLIDETARPTGIFAAYNAVQNPAKELMILPFSDHQGHGNAQMPFRVRAVEWRQALRTTGAPPPPRS